MPTSASNKVNGPIRSSDRDGAGVAASRPRLALIYSRSHIPKYRKWISTIRRRLRRNESLILNRYTDRCESPFRRIQKIHETSPRSGIEVGTVRCVNTAEDNGAGTIAHCARADRPGAEGLHREWRALLVPRVDCRPRIVHPMRTKLSAARRAAAISVRGRVAPIPLKLQRRLFPRGRGGDARDAPPSVVAAAP
ncbi:hypothetical protein EVAR_55776_1 [Eumeta japonica]|uniref:Uncharacterized protein n=1 Tax=Eumeta variegata TaxID=151549 RepID=A0A4C1YP69_EUMVA|nr:hypothetical protein EVAR_55776_1 [Eumeta japonica]